MRITGRGREGWNRPQRSAKCRRQSCFEGQGDLGLIVDESCLIVAREGSGDAHLSECFPPFNGNTPRRLADHPARVGLRDLEELAGFECQADRSIVRTALKDRRFEMRVAVGRRVYVEYRRQAPPARSHIEEAVVLQMIILVRHEDGEDQAQKELAEIGLRIGGLCAHEVDDLRIGAEFGPGLAEGGARRDVGNTCSPPPVEPLDQRDRKRRVGQFQPDFGSADAACPGEAERRDLDASIGC